MHSTHTPAKYRTHSARTLSQYRAHFTQHHGEARHPTAHTEPAKHVFTYAVRCSSTTSSCPPLLIPPPTHTRQEGREADLLPRVPAPFEITGVNFGQASQTFTKSEDVVPATEMSAPVQSLNLYRRPRRRRYSRGSYPGSYLQGPGPRGPRTSCLSHSLKNCNLREVAVEVDLPAWGTGTRVLPNVVLISVATHSSTTSHSVRAYDGKLSLLSICTDARLTAAVWHSPGSYEVLGIPSWASCYSQYYY
eukprot:1137499-Rhodomonas_salina.1